VYLPEQVVITGLKPLNLLRTFDAEVGLQMNAWTELERTVQNHEHGHEAVAVHVKGVQPFHALLACVVVHHFSLQEAVPNIPAALTHFRACLRAVAAALVITRGRGEHATLDIVHLESLCWKVTPYQHTVAQMIPIPTKSTQMTDNTVKIELPTPLPNLQSMLMSACMLGASIAGRSSNLTHAACNCATVCARAPTRQFRCCA
jgi:hypothetical protein